MSNAVRNISSNRNVDLTRFGSGHQSDPSGTDGEFSAVMNSMIGGVDGAAEGNSEGANSQADTGGQGSSPYGTPYWRSDGRVVTGAAGSLGGAFAAVAPTATKPQGRDTHVVLQGDANGRGRTVLVSGDLNQATSTASPAQPDATATPLGASRSRDEPKRTFASESADADGEGTFESSRVVPTTTVTSLESQSEHVRGTPAVPSPHRDHPDAQSTSTLSQPTSGANFDGMPSGIASNGDDVASNNLFVTAPIFQPVPDSIVDGAVTTRQGSGSTTLSPRPVGPMTAQPFVMTPSTIAKTVFDIADSDAAASSPSAGSNASSPPDGPTLADPSPRQLGFDRNTLKQNPDAAAPTASSSNTSMTAPELTAATDEVVISNIAPRQAPASSQDQSGAEGALVAISDQPAPANPSATTSTATILPPSSPPNTPASPDSGVPASSVAVQTAPVQPFVVAGPMVPARGVDLHSGGQSSPTAVDGVTGSISISPSDLPTGTTTILDGQATGISESFADALAHHVMSMVSNGDHEVTLQLQPPQLGEMTIRIAVQGRDVSTWFGAAQPQAQLAVGQALDQLRSDLAGAGLNLAGAWVGSDASTARQTPFEAANPTPRRWGFVATVENSSVSGNETDNRLSGVNVYA